MLLLLIVLCQCKNKRYYLIMYHTKSTTDWGSAGAHHSVMHMFLHVQMRTGSDSETFGSGTPSSPCSSEELFLNLGIKQRTDTTQLLPHTGFRNSGKPGNSCSASCLRNHLVTGLVVAFYARLGTAGWPPASISSAPLG